MAVSSVSQSNHSTSMIIKINQHKAETTTSQGYYNNIWHSAITKLRNKQRYFTKDMNINQFNKIRLGRSSLLTYLCLHMGLWTCNWNWIAEWDCQSLDAVRLGSTGCSSCGNWNLLSRSLHANTLCSWVLHANALLSGTYVMCTGPMVHTHFC